ncbi:hypothetical protein ACIA5D_19270 [Actinoplanes sp. NPDC051513]|uniref:hypothetical protein n=1 Tax=Actinoplanes sp. NPDC051513 TaxID=3363908 RepID=UPI00379D5857
MTLLDFSLARLRARVDSLGADLADWIARASKPGNLGIHRNQLGRLETFIVGTLDTVVDGTPLDPVDPPPGGSVDDLPGLRRGIGSAHLIWDFFRDKLAQRDMAEYTTHLGAADDLAWGCYEPFLRASAPGSVALREPPLVFYSTDRTPFAQARTKTLHPPGLDAKDLQFFQAALQRLPVPVIGLPWDIANRMPETALVGHETGHVIAEDLGLAAEAKAALAAAELSGDRDDARRRVWVSWCDEIFADVIGVLATGSAYVEGLVLELAGQRDDVRLARIDAGDPGRYPTAALRVALCQRLLTGVGVTPTTDWAQTYGPIVGDSRDYAPDVAVVAPALLGRAWTTLAGRQLADILPWTAVREQQAARVGRQLLDGQPPSVPFDVRVWVAAAMHAYRLDAAAYTKGDLDARLATMIVNRRQAGVRSTRTLTPGRTLSEEQVREADRKAGADLVRDLGLAGKRGIQNDHDQ